MKEGLGEDVGKQVMMRQRDYYYYYYCAERRAGAVLVASPGCHCFALNNIIIDLWDFGKDMLRGICACNDSSTCPTWIAIQLRSER